jgi:hypothetical protein
MSVDYNVDGVARSYSLLELAQRGVIATDGSHETIRIENDGTDVRITW